jgi:hypothetical protein
MCGELALDEAMDLDECTGGAYLITYLYFRPLVFFKLILNFMSKLKRKPATHLVVTRVSRTWHVNIESVLSFAQNCIERCSVDITRVRGMGGGQQTHHRVSVTGNGYCGVRRKMTFDGKQGTRGMYRVGCSTGENGFDLGSGGAGGG